VLVLDLSHRWRKLDYLAPGVAPPWPPRPIPGFLLFLPTKIYIFDRYNFYVISERLHSLDLNKLAKHVYEAIGWFGGWER